MLYFFNLIIMKSMNTNMNESLISYYTMRNFNRAFIDIIPHYHSGVGLDYYCQSTSPIRRYNDILVHRQIKSHIFNEKLLNDEEVNEICQSVHEIHKIAKEIEFEVSENWLYADLLRRYKNNGNELYNGVIMGINSDRFGCELEILLNEFGFSVNVESNRSYIIGENIKLKMKKEPTKSINGSDWLEIV